MPGSEDFGLAPVEANAAGKPVVAFADGGALETIQDGVTGVFFREHSVNALLDAFRRCEAITSTPEQIAKHAQRFSRQAFRNNLRRVLTDAYCEWETNAR